MPHNQGHRSPNKAAGGGEVAFKSNPILARDAERAQTNLMRILPGPKDPTETETELCLSVSCGGMGQQWTTTGAGALHAADLGMA